MAKALKPRSQKQSAKKAAVKKPVAKKSATAKSETGIKYSDKSGDQPELVPVFNGLKKLLMPYGKGSIAIRGGTGGQITLVSNKPVEIAGKLRKELWFAAALVQRGYVGFYFMPPATEAQKKEIFKPALWKCLKGKSCFHIKKLDAELSAQVEQALEKGYAAYKEKGWL